MAARRQFVRFAIVGLLSNAILYVIYLALTNFGLGPKIAMSTLYVVGVIQTFFFNKKWSFRFAGTVAPALVRYATVYALGYLINLLALMIFVDNAGFAHQYVQGAMILIIAVLLFIAQRFWVFPQAPKNDPL